MTESLLEPAARAPRRSVRAAAPVPPTRWSRSAVCALALAAATVARSANAGVAAGLAGWTITVLSGQVADGRLTAAVSNSALIFPYLAFAAICGAIALYATRLPRGTS